MGRRKFGRFIRQFNVELAEQTLQDKAAVNSHTAVRRGLVPVGKLLRRCVRSGRIEALGEAEAGSAGKQPRQGITESKGWSHSTREGRCMSAVTVVCTVLLFLDVLIGPGF
jgi:hypothetical protein